jgi:hypothetical protein
MPIRRSSRSDNDLRNGRLTGSFVAVKFFGTLECAAQRRDPPAYTGDCA